MAEKILSVFIDESGDFGDYNPIAPYYSVTQQNNSQSLRRQILKMSAFFLFQSQSFRNKRLALFLFSKNFEGVDNQCILQKTGMTAASKA